MLPQALAMVNGKGGTFKTSVVSNLAGLVAGAGYKVLAVDLDPQGNLGRDLGYLAEGHSDDGQGLLGAVISGQRLEPLREVRSNLDVVCGGDATEDMAGTLFSRGVRGESPVRAVRDQLAPLAPSYHLMMLDCPPGNRHLQRLALAAARYVVIPTRADDGSLDGLVRVARLFGSMREGENPDLELLGVVLCGVGSRSKRIAARTRRTVASDLGDSGLIFDSQIRYVEGPAQECRQRGQLVHELEATAAAAKRQRLEWLRSSRQSGGRHERKDPPASPSASAPGLAEDYQNLAGELTQRITQRAAAGEVPA